MLTSNTLNDSKASGTQYYFTRNIVSAEAARKPVVVCVHGIGSYSDHFESIKDHLILNEFDVVTYDLIGRGRSDYPESNVFDGPAHVTQLRNLIEHLQLQRADKYHIIAHSMGGAIAALYAAQYRDEIASIVFLSPAGLMDLGPLGILRNCCGCFQGVIKSIIRSNQESAWRNDFVSHRGEALEIENNFVENMRNINNENKQMFDAFWQSALQFPLSGIDESVQRVASSDNISIMLMWGTSDKAVPFSPNFLRWKTHLDTNLEQYKTSKLIKYVVYDNLGHAFFLENSKEVLPEIVAFYSEIKKYPINAAAT